VALAPFFDRTALAASQVLAGFDPDAFTEFLTARTVGLSVDSASADLPEGQALTDMAVRLLARMYPVIALNVPDGRIRSGLQELAHAINPRIEFSRDAECGIAVGKTAKRFNRTVFAGSAGTAALVGTKRPYGVGPGQAPFAAGAAACLAAANLFRMVFLPLGRQRLDTDMEFSVFQRTPDPRIGLTGLRLPLGTALIGLGAIGHGAAWAMSRSSVGGHLDVIDPETVDLGNLQRYVLSTMAHVGVPKTRLIREALDGRITVTEHAEPFDSYAATVDYRLVAAAVALDSAKDRRSVQASLPRRVINAWTQPGDLGVSVHAAFGSSGACLECMYLDTRPAPNEDQIVAAALGLTGNLMPVRELLYSGRAVSDALLDTVAESLSIEPSLARRFSGRTLRELYVEGICGGALVPLGRAGAPRGEVHVPLAHQSALAGVLLAAALVEAVSRSAENGTLVTRIDVLNRMADVPTQKVAAVVSGCICRDSDYVGRFAAKWESAPSLEHEADLGATR